jgi:hypothetical protein
VSLHTTSLWSDKAKREEPGLVIVEPDSTHDRRVLVRFVWHRVMDGAFGVVVRVEGVPVIIERWKDRLAVKTERGVYTTRRVRILFRSLYDLEMHQKICREDTGCIYVFYSASAVY